MKATHTLIISLAFCLAITFSSSAHNKVVVVPLGSDRMQRAETVERTLVFNSNSLGGSAEQVSTGRLFPDGVLRSASMFVKKPQDWNGTSEVTVELFARGLGLGSETFNIIVTDFDDGDRFGTISDDPFSVTSTNRLFQQVGQLRTFTSNFPPGELQQDWWHIDVRRNGTAGTNMSTIILNSVAITYTAINQ